MPFVPVKFIGIFSDTQSIYNRIVVDHSFLLRNMWSSSCIVIIMNVCMMRKSISGYHFCVGKCVLSWPSIQGVATSTFGKTSVMSASGADCAALGGSWRHHWRVWLRVSLTQLCKTTGGETGVFPRLHTRLCYARTRYQRSMTQALHALTTTLLIHFCDIALTLHGVYSHGQCDGLSLCASRRNSIDSTKSVRCSCKPRCR